ncbi:hypothetical protein [Amphibacillus marinus]|nr:hypothetical protein [Amphibacillus marinus]
MERIIQEQGRINVLFSNAGYRFYGAVEDARLTEARHPFEVNFSN